MGKLYRTRITPRRINHHERILIPFKSEFDQSYYTDGKNWKYVLQHVSKIVRKSANEDGGEKGIAGDVVQ